MQTSSTITERWFINNMNRNAWPACMNLIRLSGIIAANDSDHVPVKLEGVGPVAMRGLLLQVLWEIDDHDGIERAFLHDVQTLCFRRAINLHSYSRKR